MEPTLEEIQKSQGTRLSDVNPWDSYESELNVKMSEELAAQVAEYSERRYDYDQTSNQNKEVLAEEIELSRSVAQEHQWVKPEEYEDESARTGTPMTHAEFITKLRSIGIICFYRQHPHPDKAVLFVQKNSSLEPVNECWVQIGLMPELSIMKFDDHGAPLAEKKRGWRTPLLQLILKGIITEEKANKLFGKPKEYPQYNRYNSTLHAFRNAGNSLEEQNP